MCLFSEGFQAQNVLNLFLLMAKITTDVNGVRAVSRARFGQTGSTEILDSFIKTIHCDTFKQT